MEILYIVFGLTLGGVIVFLWMAQRSNSEDNNSEEIELLKQENKNLQFAFKSEEDKYKRSEDNLNFLKEVNESKEKELRGLGTELAILKTRFDSNNERIQKLQEEYDVQRDYNGTLQEQINKVKIESSELRVSKDSTEKEVISSAEKLTKVNWELEGKITEFNVVHKELAIAQANNKALTEKLETQKIEIENLGKKFSIEFQNIANKILEEKTEKFTNVNKQSLETILKPFGENIATFKKQVEESYNKEAKERFSLGEQVKEMAKLNKIISAEARNLTTALKGEAKTQGNWGEMILESILEKSGLTKNQEYFTEHQLTDDEGKPLRSDSENKKMRPDVVIKYPDNRSVIIDSKVSLNAFSRYLSATEKEEQDVELHSHVAAIKNHIVSLSTKGYDDYDKALDFVMMFVPSEPAYIAAMQGDSNLWNFAYDKRILLMNPTNLITSLKLIVDLWKREYQNQNAIEIANRGGKLYDKFVGFVKNLEDVGTHIVKAQGKYDEAYKQLTTGNDNLVSQATKLKALGVKNKKELSQEVERLAKEERS